ncbi:hypothetical protein BpHYR1_003544 [Brachionus plicatilis]|uniref:Uncharacterized protein n=1 Tax=Brachionus plicatilis TaxID=10195 RepID=A0A3M7QDC1_BRAPC|nr:hypothetical protein BpHYR1_003544 [Brachionus plicatilis]
MEDTSLALYFLSDCIDKLQQASLWRWLTRKPSMIKSNSKNYLKKLRDDVPLVDDPVGEEVCSLLTFGRDLARKSSPVSPNITSWSCLRERVAVFHRFHPAYSVESACLIESGFFPMILINSNQF